MEVDWLVGWFVCLFGLRGAVACDVCVLFGGFVACEVLGEVDWLVGCFHVGWFHFVACEVLGGCVPWRLWRVGG